MRRRWLKFILWWNHICPKHGEKYCGRGGAYFCPACEEPKRRNRILREAAHRAILDRYCKELGEK